MKKRYTIPLIILFLLIIFRLLLPTIIKNYVNNVLSDIPEYSGHVESIDLAFYRGAYVIHNLTITKVKTGNKHPFLNFKKTDISIEWKSLLDGRILSEIIITDPKLIYVSEDQHAEDIKAESWTKALTSLVPIDINRLEIVNGTAAFIDPQADPAINLNLQSIKLVANNLRNVIQQERILPSEVNASAVSFGNGELTINGKMNLVKEIPDIDISLSLVKADITSLNNFTQHYAKIDFDSGVFELFGEIAIADGYLKGSIKPILKNTKLINKKDSFLSVLWEGFVGFFKFILKNQKNKTLATKIPIEGNLNNVGAKVWPTVTGIFKNAWIKAFTEKVDDDISFKDAEKEADKLKK